MVSKLVGRDAVMMVLVVLEYWGCRVAGYWLPWDRLCVGLYCFSELRLVRYVVMMR
jgi:hypothetical protein